MARKQAGYSRQRGQCGSRGLTLTGLCITVAGALAACAFDPPPPVPPTMPEPVASTTPSPITVLPKVGDCWNEPDYEVASSWRWWQGSASVDCADEHNSITYVIGEVGDEFAYDDTKGPMELTDEQIGTITRICTPAEWQGIGLREGSRATFFWYLPTPDEWASGDRWLRCDVAVVALGPLTPKTLELLPATADEVRPGIADQYRLCLDTAHPAVVYGPWYDPDGNVAVTCDREAQWEFGLRIQVPDGPFPGDEALRAMGEQACQELVNSRTPERWGATLAFPDEQTWTQGSRSLRCWLRE